VGKLRLLSALPLGGEGAGDGGDGLRGYLVGGTAGVFSLRVLSAVLGFGVNLVLARTLGAGEYGVYHYVLAWVGLLAVVSAFGLDQVVVREIAAHRAGSDWSLLYGLLRRILRYRLIVAAIVISAAAGIAWLIGGLTGRPVPLAFWIALGLVPILSLSNLANAALQGLRRVVVGIGADAVVAKPLLLVLLLSLPWWFTGNFTAIDAICISVATAIVALLLRAVFLWRRIPQEALENEPAYRGDIWLASAIPLLAVALLFELNTRAPILLLGPVTGKEATGVFALSSALVGLVGFVLISINVVLSPVISSLYSTGEMTRLQRIVTHGARAVMVIGGLGTLGLILSRGWILGFFGREYMAGSSVLVILAMGQMANLAGGSAGTILVMTGREREVAMTMGLSVLITLTLGATLIPLWGAAGAAVAVLVSTVAWNAILVVRAVKSLGIDPTAVGIFTRFKRA